MKRTLLATVEEVKAQVHFNTKLLQIIAKKLDNISTANFEEVEEDVRGLDIPITSKENSARICLRNQYKQTIKIRVCLHLSSINIDGIGLGKIECHLKFWKFYSMTR